MKTAFMILPLFFCFCFFAGCSKHEGELGSRFVADLLKQTDKSTRERFAAQNDKKTITLSGTVSEIWISQVGGGFFYIETPETRGSNPRLMIAVEPSKEISSQSDKPGAGVITCESGLTIRNGDKVTVTGIFWDYNDSFLDGMLFRISNAYIEK